MAIENRDLYLEQAHDCAVNTIDVAQRFSDELLGEQGSNVLELPNNMAVRSDADSLNLGKDRDEELRGIASELGMGSMEDIVPEGIKPGFIAVIEGGLAHKIVAEQKLVLTVGGAGYQIYMGSPDRSTNDRDLDFVRSAYGVDRSSAPANEYELAELVARQQAGFKSAHQPAVLRYFYDIRDGHKLTHEPEGHLLGQFVSLGWVDVGGGDSTLVHMRIDREDYKDQSGKSKFRNRPGTAESLGILSDLFDVSANEAPLVEATSSLYLPSRQIDAYRAGLKHGREMRVMAYGAKTLALVQGMEEVQSSDINQFPGELKKAYSHAIKLQETIDKIRID